ncbi:hypothetical protein SFC07_10985 [Corynebacterium callunae]|uniref:hypothetical protein n=1 Tax=Corynebacterium callunae TaxID=1721 RepID=UPI0039823520
MTNNQSQWRQPWFIRRVVYAVVALALLIAVGAGWITEDQSASILSQADQLLGVLAALGLSVASAKANPQSDLKNPDQAA